MFDRNLFLQKVSTGDFDGAIAMLSTASNSDYQPSKGEHLLEMMVQSEELNRELALKSDSAIKLMELVISESTLEKPRENGGALLLAVKCNHRATAGFILNDAKRDRYGDPLKVCKQQDLLKNTALHYAIIHCDHEMIAQLLGVSIKSLFFKKNNAGLYSLALALDCYQKNPNELTISICNQLYFALPKGDMRSRAVEESVQLGHWMWSKPLWRHALRLCAKRDVSGKITSADMNFIDLVNQVTKDGLTVMGFNVDWDVIYYYSKSYSGTPGDLLRESVANMGKNLSGRTLGQTAVNDTLAKNKEFLNRAKLEQKEFALYLSTVDPQIVGNLNHLNKNTTYIVLHQASLFYVSKWSYVDDRRECIEINREELYEGDKNKFDKLVEKIKTLRKEAILAAPEDLQNIFSVLPTHIVSKSTTTKTTLPKGKGTGMTLFANYAPPVLPMVEEKGRDTKPQNERFELTTRKRTFSLSSSDSE